MYYTPAFDARSLETIAMLVLLFACNAVDINGRAIVNDASDVLQSRLRAAGFVPVVIPLSEFLKAGGDAKCLTLKLIEI